MNKRNVQILSFYAITLYNYEYYKNKGGNKSEKLSDNTKNNIEKKWSNTKE